MSRRKGIVWLLLPLVLLGLLLPGCFTSTLWATDVDSMSWTTDEDYEQEHHFPIWARILFTPVAIALDILTAPIQDFFSDEDDDDDC